MSFEFDHAFICCAPGAPEAELLSAVGLTEGSRNTHAGQGTENRRFFFENGFLELLWVSDAKEAQDPLTRRTRLWERWSQRGAGACPFGMAFRSTGSGAEEPPFPSWRYCPAYLPAGFSIWFADGARLNEPELIGLARPASSSRPSLQPTGHAIPLRRIVSVVVGLPAGTEVSTTLQTAASAGLFSLRQDTTHVLELEFETEREILHDFRPSLPLAIKGALGAGGVR